jgi:SAM-dependent methyltransferase
MNFLDTPLHNFNEQDYLAQNPDVAEAVHKRQFASGWQHFVQFGYREDRGGVASTIKDEMRRYWDHKSKQPTVPPRELRRRVHGNDDFAAFEFIGRCIGINLKDAIGSTSIKFQENGRIVDFGCGCGRVIVHFHEIYRSAEFYGTDIDAQAIHWCRDHLGHVSNFAVNNAWPPLNYPDRFFDLVYSVSVFTHLPEHMQFAWLSELRRVAKERSYLLLTTHSMELLPANLLAAEPTKPGFIIRWEKEPMACRNFYQTSFHSGLYIQ